MILYNLFIHLYSIFLHILFPFSRKPRKMIKGYWVLRRVLRQQYERGEKYLWFHAASLGEFEQGRPLIEAIRARYPNKYKILLTFFSPSGYEVRKHYQGADVVCYLPLDTRFNAFRFVNYTKPHAAFFIKYEFWRNYIHELRRRGIPVYSISSVFRKEQLFFKWYGGLHRECLSDFTQLFVQNEVSKRFLAHINIDRTTVVGDTRFDRVVAISKEARELPVIEQFARSEKPVIVAGSTWRPDEDLLIEYFNTHQGVKLIIAPHVVSDLHVTEIIDKLRRPYMRMSRIKQEQISTTDCLIIDSYGMLSSIYRYGVITYVGGGFGKGIHNILEAAVYGLPVIFGARYDRFIEAHELIEAGGGFSISCAEELTRLLDQFVADKDYLASASKRSYHYVQSKTGATERILGAIDIL